MTDWIWELRLRAQRLALISMLVLIVMIKDWPPASCGGND
jgi:hypothetical protein